MDQIQIDMQIDIQGQLDNALPSDVIQLPDDILNFPLIISKPCTVMGFEHTEINVTEEDVAIAVQILSDSVTFSDIIVKNKTETGYNSIYVKGDTVSLERLSVSCDVGILLDQCNDIDLIEIKAFNASTGIKIFNSMNVDINACDAYNNNIGLDIIGDSSVKGDVESYQGFGLSVQATDISSLSSEKYEFKIDGMLFSFSATVGMTYQDIVNVINTIDGLNPIYVAEFKDGDIVIKTQNPLIAIESDNNATDLLTSLSASLTAPDNGNIHSYVDFGLSVQESETTPLLQNTLFTFILDGNEVQFYSPEANANIPGEDGTTYSELVDLLNSKINSGGYIVEFIGGDIRITKDAPSITLTKGTRFKDLFTELNLTTFKPSVYVQESIQGFGLNVQESDSTSLVIGTSYSININGADFDFINTTSNPTYTQLVTLLNTSLNTGNHKALFSDSDIKIVSSEPTIMLEKKNSSLLPINGAVLAEAIIGSEETRKDRSHNINVIGSLFHENVIGVRVMNSNDITLLSNTKIFFNTNIGIWQMPSSYNVKFRGEIYENGNYGIRNTDKTGGPHEVDAMDSWWGDLTGPSMFGTGEGDKISANVLWQPQRQTGTVPDLSYPKTRDFILGALGYPVVKVELTDEQIAMCIDKAIEKYMQYRTPEPTQRYIALGAGSDSYFLPLDIPKEEIIEVTYSPNADIFAQLSGSGESFMMTYYMNGAGSSFLSDFYVAMAYKETMESVLGIGAAYELLSAKNTDGEWQDAIRLSPRPDGNVSLGLLVSRPLTEEEVDSIEWIHKYALAWAKEFLGRIRSKFGSVPGPTGEMQLDGPTLLGEAQQEKVALEESVMLRGTPLGFIVG